MPAIERTYDEKRDFIRMQINSPVAMTQEGKTYKGLCKDLSGTGMMIETQDSFDIGTELHVSIEQKDDIHKPFNASVVVARAEQQSNDSVLLGLTIKEILP